jgi:RNA polymerase sigma-70 factor (ECF subfamily)
VSDEKQLLVAAKNGSQEAFSQLLLLYQDRLYRFLVARCRVRHDAEDALQETFVSAYKYLHSYDERWQFSTWLYRIALRKAYACHGTTETLEEEPVDDSQDPLAACIAASDRENLWLTAKRVLETEAFTAMWLRYAEDMPVRDVANVLGRPLSWTKVSLMRSRNRLGNEMAGQDAAVAGGR